ncbi:MAG: alpha-glucosidase, partial [Sphingomonadales bacterium]|nr:alpha-glucosidase [Sphingomonadales bacterium]
MIRILLLILALFAVPAAAAPVEISSPEGILAVTVDVNGEGRPEYSVSRLGRPVILPSRLGFILTDAPKLERNFAIASSERRSADETWEQPWGERRFVRNRYNELKVRLTERAPPGRSLDLVFRVYDDG